MAEETIAIVCPQCNGKGWIGTRHHDPQRDETDPCPECEGTPGVTRMRADLARACGYRRVA